MAKQQYFRFTDPKEGIGFAGRGIDMLSQETAMPAGSWRDIVNFGIDNAGALHSRDGSTLLATITGTHDIWSPREQEYGLYAQNDELRRLDVAGSSLSATVMASGLTRNTRMRYAQADDTVYWTNGHEIGIANAFSASQLGVPVPDDAPTLSAIQGAQSPGRFGVAITFVDDVGEESGMSPIAFIDSAGGGVLASLPFVPPGIASIRIYCTTPDGEDLYLATEVPYGFTQANVQDIQRTKRATTQNHSRMLGGTAIAYYRGRVYVARGSMLWYSETLTGRGRIDIRSNWVRFEAPIVWLQGVGGGIYVGTRAGVIWLSGDQPSTFKPVQVDSAPVSDDCILVPGAFLGGDIKEYACWLGSRGFVIGGPDGTIKRVQSARIALDDHGTGAMAAITRNGIDQIIHLVAATVPASQALATTTTLN